MKKYLFIILAIVLNVAVIAQNNDQTPFLTKTFSGESFSAAQVRTSGGNIVVTGSDQADSRVEVYIQPSNGRTKLSNEEIQQRLDEMYELELTVSNNKLVAIAKQKPGKKDWKKALSIGFKVFVPKKTDTELTTSGGNISLSGLTGKQEFTTSGGNLRLDGLSGSIRGRTSGGNIHASNSSEDLDLTTSGGNIEASSCSGKMRLGTSGGSLFLRELNGEIKATTSGGNIDGKNIGGDLFARTSGGNIHFKDLASSLDASTSGGNIHVSVKELGKSITITNSSGTVELDIPGGKGIDLTLRASRIKTDRLENFTGKMEEDEIDGQLNGGGIPVKVKAGSGRIVLAFK